MAAEKSTLLNAKQFVMALAYGMFLVSTSALLWGGYVVVLDGEHHQDFVLIADFLVRNICFPLSLFVAGILTFFSSDRFGRFFIPLCCVLLVVGGIALVFLDQTEGTPLAIRLLLGFSFGAGCGIVFCSFQRVLANRNVYSAGIVVILAAGISAVLYICLSILPDEYTFWATAFILLPVSLLLLYLISRSEDFSHPMYKLDLRNRIAEGKSACKTLWRPLVCVALSAFIAGLVRAHGVLDLEFMAGVNTLNMLGLFVSAVILVILWRYHFAKITMDRVYQVMFPITATVYLLLPFLGGTYVNVFVSAVFLVFSIASSLMVITCIREARKQSIHPVCVYGFFAGGVYTASLLGSVVGLLLNPEEGLGSNQLLIIALVALYALTLVPITSRRSKGKASESGNETVAVPEASVVYRIEDQCAEISKKFGLSKREGEVLLLLARGRDTPYIAEELYISKNTVRTHTKNIFVKTDVHSKQELMSAVEAVRLETKNV